MAYASDVGRTVIVHDISCCATVTHYQVVVCLTTYQRLCGDGACQVNDMVERSLQRKFTMVISTVGGIVTAGIINLEGGLALWQRHGECCTVRRHRHIPLGIERRAYG